MPIVGVDFRGRLCGSQILEEIPCCKMAGGWVGGLRVVGVVGNIVECSLTCNVWVQGSIFCVFGDTSLPYCCYFICGLILRQLLVTPRFVLCELDLILVYLCDRIKKIK